MISLFRLSANEPNLIQLRSSKPRGADGARPALPQGLAATTSALIYLAFSAVRFRYRAERLANRASQDVENPWNLIAFVQGQGGRRNSPADKESFA